MAPAGRNGSILKLVAPNPWGWVDQVTSRDTLNVTQQELMRSYRISGYRECLYLNIKKRPAKCKKNPYCLWGLGDHVWRGEEDIFKEEQSQIREEGQIAGLLNQGQTCYVNSLLQLWYHNPILRPAILSWEPPPETTANPTTYVPLCAVSHLQMMFARMKASKQRTIDTVSFVTALGLDPGQQQDAEEFAKLLLTCVTQLLENSSRNQNISRVFRTCFTGESQFQTTCEHCHTVTSGRTEEFNELQLSVLPSLERAFHHYFREERLENDNQYFCNGCFKKQDAIRKVKILKLPQVLNIQLMRFVFDPTTMEKKKVMKTISFPETLDMTGYLEENTNGSQHIYVLNAVLIHHGNKASSGHYTSHIKDPVSGCWIECNDDKVAEINNRKNPSKKLVIKSDGPYRLRPQKTVLTKTTEEAEAHPNSETNSSTFNSKGAYMLVYTRREDFSAPQSDPELPIHLAEVIKREDAIVEAELHELKLAKEAEAQKRAERQFEIDILYSVKYPPPESEDKENKGSGNGKNNGSNDIEILSSRQPSPRPETPTDISSLDFISTAWLERWLTYMPLEDLPHISNADILCKHGKLAPPGKAEQGADFKIIPSAVAETLYERYNGHRLNGEDALCNTCVTAHCHCILDLRQLEDDAKKVADSVRTCDQEFERNGKQLTPAFHGTKFLVGRESLKEWKKYAKQQIQQSEIEMTGSGGGYDEGQDEWKLNAELTCNHGFLCITRSLRKRILSEGYMILLKYFPNSNWYVSGERECAACLSEQQSNQAVFQEYKQYAMDEKQKLNDLFKGWNRPTSGTLGTFSLIPLSFLESWKEFIRNPVSEPPSHISTIDLLCDTANCKCSVPQLKFPFYLLQSEYPVTEPQLFNNVVMIREAEMQILMERRSTDVGITVTIKEDPKDKNKRIYEHNIGICELSAITLLDSFLEQRFTYESNIIVRKFEEDEELLECNGHELLVLEDDDGISPPKLLRPNDDPNGQLRRSGRRRASRNDQKYKINSSTKIRDFQRRELCRDYNVGLSDQHLYWKGKELTEDERQMTFCDMRIAAGSMLFLKIDKQMLNGDGKHKEEPPKIRPPAQVERGFTGTALLRPSFMPTPRIPTPVVSPSALAAALGSPMPTAGSPSAPPWTPSQGSFLTTVAAVSPLATAVSTALVINPALTDVSAASPVVTAVIESVRSDTMPGSPSILDAAFIEEPMDEDEDDKNSAITT